MPREIEKVMARLTRIADEQATILRESLSDLFREHGFGAITSVMQDLVTTAQNGLTSPDPEATLAPVLALKAYCDTVLAMHDQGAFADLP